MSPSFEDNSGPAEKPKIAIMIPISAIIRWWKNKKKKKIEKLKEKIEKRRIK